MNFSELNNYSCLVYLYQISYTQHSAVMMVTQPIELTKFGMQMQGIFNQT
jgi:hypothetical protein